MNKWEKIGLIIGAIETIVIGVAGIFAQKKITDKLKAMDLLTEDGADLDQAKLKEYCKKANEEER